MNLVFQKRLIGDDRPLEDELNYQPMFIDDASAAPLVNDYIEFASSNSGEAGIFKVVSRYFRYFLNGNHYSTCCYIVVEKDNEAAPRLIKE
jgi:hypothetical protein